MRLQLTHLCLLALLCFNCKETPQTSEVTTTDTKTVHGRKTILNNPAQQGELYQLLKAKDSLMFELSYNQLDTSILEELAMEDIEFYHDQGGATYTKADFINGMKSLGNLSYKARREATKGTIEVYPMYQNGELYAAILKGEHAFYAKEPNDKPEYLTSTAKYTILWKRIDTKWKMSRIYSYDHQAPKHEL